ncbi:hypothetical protein [Litorimonas sp. WD9-15]|uniref:hypothetical protein n=1 Tax=Litorimonas sp. WD9-15 TaxID=3418716 RepID=UPI003D060941
MSILHTVCALLSFALILLENLPPLSLLGIVFLHFVLSALIVKFGKGPKAHRLARRGAIDSNAGLGWAIISLSFLLPLGVGFAVYFLNVLNFDQSLLAFLGTSYLAQILVNQMILPKITSNLSSTFD